MMERKKPHFKRQNWNKMSKLGKGRKKKQRWRHPKGRDSKLRLGEKAYGRKVKIGWGGAKKDRKDVVRIVNVEELKSVKNKEIIIGGVGKKKREEIIKIAKEKGIKILNKYRKVKTKSGDKEDATG